jgi:AraC family ethanolamine operon transcriptional activator
MTVSSFRKSPAGRAGTLERPARASELEVLDIDALCEAVRGSGLDHRQLDRGAFQGRISRHQCGQLLIDRGVYNRAVISQGRFAPGRVTVGCLLGGIEPGCINGRHFGRFDVAVFPEAAEMDYLVPRFTEWTAIQVGPEELAAYGVAPEALEQMAVYAGNRPSNAALARTLRRLVETDTIAPAASEIAEDILMLIREVLTPSGDGRDYQRRASFDKRACLIRGFEAAIQELGGESPRIPALADRLGVSQRSLELVFKQHLGLSPLRFARLIRLHETRRRLQAACADSATVSQVASDLGFGNLGRFAAEYRLQFGELPSVTLERRRLRTPAGAPGPTKAPAAGGSLRKANTP